MKNTAYKAAKEYKHLATLALAVALLPAAVRAADKSDWIFDVSLYGVAAGMSGNVTAKGVPADIDVGFDQILENLKMGGMGTVRVGYDRWSLSADVIYMDLAGSKGTTSVEAQQWLVQPMLGYQLCPGFAMTAGTRYNNLDVTVQTTTPLGSFRATSGTIAWWDPILGAQVGLPLGKKFSFNFSGDIGGFGVGSDLTWQAYPYFDWQFAKCASLQLGYRFLYTDYESGSGATLFKYDILTSGPQVGFTFHF